MTTRELFHLAWGAARRAARDETDGRSPMSAALDATAAHHTPMRFRVACVAEQLTNMSQGHRLRRHPRLTRRHMRLTQG